MPWKKKFPGLAGAVSAPLAPGKDAIAGLAEPALPHASSLIGNPTQSPQMPKFSGNPDIHEEIKRRALANIAAGKKGF